MWKKNMRKLFSDTSNDMSTSDSSPSDPDLKDIVSNTTPSFQEEFYHALMNKPYFQPSLRTFKDKLENTKYEHYLKGGSKWCQKFVSFEGGNAVTIPVVPFARYFYYFDVLLKGKWKEDIMIVDVKIKDLEIMKLFRTVDIKFEDIEPALTYFCAKTSAYLYVRFPSNYNNREIIENLGYLVYSEELARINPRLSSLLPCYFGENVETYKGYFMIHQLQKHKLISGIYAAEFCYYDGKKEEGIRIYMDFCACHANNNVEMSPVWCSRAVDTFKKYLKLSLDHNVDIVPESITDGNVGVLLNGLVRFVSGDQYIRDIECLYLIRLCLCKSSICGKENVIVTLINDIIGGRVEDYKEHEIEKMVSILCKELPCSLSTSFLNNLILMVNRLCNQGSTFSILHMTKQLYGCCCVLVVLSRVKVRKNQLSRVNGNDGVGNRDGIRSSDNSNGITVMDQKEISNPEKKCQQMGNGFLMPINLPGNKSDDMMN